MEFFPLTPGHEIAGKIQAVGANVKDFKVGDRVGVGCFVDSCGTCPQCKMGCQNYCRQQVQTYGTPYREGLGHDDCAGFHTNGGYSSQITVKSDFCYHVPESLGLEYAGPLLCAGITMFSPLNRHVLQKEDPKAISVGIVGFGGLGQTGVKLAKAMGADVTVLSRSLSKKAQAEALGAKIVAHGDPESLKAAAGSFDVMIDTVSVAHDVASLMGCLKVFGTYVCIGGVAKPIEIPVFPMMFSNYKLEGSLVGGIPETQQMLDFCAKNNILPDIKVIPASEAAKHFEALHSGPADTVRAVIDMKTLKDL